MKLRSVLYKHKLTLILLGFSVGLGVANITGWFYVAFISSAGLYYLFSLIKKPSKKLFVVTWLATLLYMIVAVSWFRNISPDGWDKIGVFPPSYILMFVVFLISAACSLLSATIWSFTAYLKTTLFVKKWHELVLFPIAFVYTELAISIGFSVLTHHSNAPIAPTWNMFSIASLVSHSPLLSFTQILGFWGSTWLIVFLASVTCSLFIYKRLRFRIFAVGLIVIGFLFFGNYINQQMEPGQTKRIDVAVVSDGQDSERNYLSNVMHIKEPSENQLLVVVLPEYSNLLHPFAGAATPIDGSDMRQEIKNKFQESNTFFVGTEDEYHPSGRYVETYIVNSNLERIKRTEKTFLIPGGEYVFPWASRLVSMFDNRTLSSFNAKNARIVHQQELTPDTESGVASQIGIAACSTLLIPSHFTKEVKEGASLLTANVSYEQFSAAPEYERLATRFSQFYAVSLQRHFALGARNGSALIINPNGETATRTSGGIARKQLSTHQHSTIYSKAGDRNIIIAITLISLCFLASSLAFSKKNKKTSSGDQSH